MTPTPETLRRWAYVFAPATILAHADAWEDDLHSLKLAREDKVTQWVEISSLHKRLEAAEKALEDIERWSHAYPLEVFPEPDFKKVRQLLEAGGITLDAVSASNMRHVVTEVGKMARAALAGGKP